MFAIAVCFGLLFLFTTHPLLCIKRSHVLPMRDSYFLITIKTPWFLKFNRIGCWFRKFSVVSLLVEFALKFDKLEKKELEKENYLCIS